MAAARDGAFRIHKVFIHRGKARGSADGLNVGILAVKIGDVLERFAPRSFIDFQRDDGLERIDDRLFGKIGDRIRVGVEALQIGLFIGEGFAGGFVGFVGGEPDLVAKGDGIVIEGKNVGFAHALAVVAVLRIIADTNDDAEDTETDALAFPKRAECRFGVVIIHIVHAIFDVVGRGDLVHLQMCFGAVQFGEQGIEQRIAAGGGMRHRSSGRIELPGRVLQRRTMGSCVKLRGAEEQCRSEERRRVCAVVFHGFTGGLAWAVLVGARSSKPGGGKMGGRS